MIFLILESHCALHFRCRINESAQRISRQRMIVAAGVHILELPGLVITPFGIRALEEKSFDFIGGVQGVTVLLVLCLGK